MPGLYVASEGRVFGAREEAACLAHLRDADRATTLREPARAAELALDAEGRMPGGFRFTQQGLRQVCNALSPGLFRFVVDLSGALRHPDDEPGEFSVAEARAAYNAALQRRFGRLERLRLVRNARTKTVDGVVGSKFVILPNVACVEKLRGALAASGGRFVEAHLAGRRLSVRYAAKDCAAQDPGGKTWLVGAWLCNSEVGGETAVLASPLLYDATTGNCALGVEYRIGRVAHVGRDFDARLAEIVGRVVPAAGDAGRLRVLLSRAATMQRISAGAAGDGEAAQIVAGMVARDIPRAVARRIVVDARHAGRLDMDLPLAAIDEAGCSVDALALSRAASKVARGRHAILRERIERLAHSVLSARL